MRNVVIWGYSIQGALLYRKLKREDEYKVIGFADNSKDKQGKLVDGISILSMEKLLKLSETLDFGS